MLKRPRLRNEKLSARWQAVGRGLAADVSRVGTMLPKRERVLPRHPVARCRQIIRAWAFGFSGNIIRLLPEALHHRQHRKSVDDGFNYLRQHLRRMLPVQVCLRRHHKQVTLKISKGLFPLTRSCDETSERADDGADRRGATNASRTVGWDRGAYTHTPGPTLSNRVFPPTESRQNCLQMTLPLLSCYQHSPPHREQCQ